MFQLGIDSLLSSKDLQSELTNKRVALLGHPASMTSDFRHSLDALMSLKSIEVTAAFGPQHGMRGDKQDNMVESENYIDPKYNIPVFSLYGEVRRPSKEMMDHFDVILIDLQDVGTRIYTYLTTLFYILEEAAKHKKSVWVLDRPNPAGRPVEGTLLREGWVSFVGASTGIPMRHGLSLGEAALWYKKRAALDVDLRVIEMKNYDPTKGPGYGWPELPWVNPSPNATTLSMARCFPGTVLLEGTPLSEGRGTTRPLEVLGAPGIDSEKLLAEMYRLAPEWLEGCLIRSCYFLPTFHKHSGELCSGFQIHVDHKTYNHNSFKPYRVIALALKVIHQLYPEMPIFRDFHYEYEKSRLAFDLINGGPDLREWINDHSASPSDLDKLCKKDETHWLSEREEFLIYPA